jgi:hypothetical protein
MLLYFEILTFALTGLLVYHSLKVRGTSFTLLFFITGAVLGILRETIVALLTDLYAYNPDAFTLWIGHAPVVLAVFWSFTIYISLSLAEGLCHADFMKGKRVVPVILVSMVFMGAYACMNEAMASTFPMVLWKFTPDIALWGETPVMVIFGYAGLAAILLTFIYLIERRTWRTWIKVATGILSTLVMIPLHLAWIALVRVTLSLFV